MIEAVSPHFAKPMLPAGAVGLRVLSLFDGMSCGQQALERIGVNVLEYYASEIDKHAIAVTMHNYPNTKQLGSVVDVDGYKLPKIDLLIGGSPCQSFSFAGKRKGMSTKCETEILTLEHYLELKNEGYEFEGQSYLFWEYMRLLNEVKPKYFLLENVMMGEKWEKILSKAIGVKPIQINSALVSAQNRNRLYWTNIGMQPMGLFDDLESIIPQPKDKGILLKDVLESEVDEKYFISDTMINRIKRTNNGERCFTTADKALCLADGYHKQGRDNQYIVASRGRNPENPKSRESGLNTEQMLEPRYDGKTNCLTSVQKDNYVVCHNSMPRSSKTGKGGTGPLSREDGKTYCLDTGQTNVIEILEKSPCLHGFEHGTNGQLNKQLVRGGMIRRLTPLECERLQTVKDNYTKFVSDTQRYRMLGNGWTVDVIAHILSYGEWS
ncbi:MAG: DNA (cytosine-5-)-methyltransferase [Chitinophagaceae bacterium]|nr:DNA (cytosine-5-)-methyltransferase [Chitinophagaceae bacterium]